MAALLKKFESKSARVKGHFLLSNYKFNFYYFRDFIPSDKTMGVGIFAQWSDPTLGLSNVRPD
jgi:hypothetical protein